ncbi:MAG: GumC family protein [Hyphomicrobiales bacterium]|nr:GumC family protein [Hyphomicrobiales bacterium]
MFIRKKAKAAPVAVPAMPAMEPAGEPDLRGLGRALWRKRQAIILFTLIVAGLAFIVVNAITPRYRSESRLLLEARESVFMRAEADKGASDRANLDPEAVTSQIQLVLSRDLALAVIKKEKLDANPEFDPAIGGMTPLRTILGLFGLARDVNSLSPEERTLEAYYDRINVYAIEKSRVIGIDFASANPELAARLANSVAESYLGLQQSAKTDQTRAASTWLATEIEKMRTKVATAEAKVEEYRSQSNLFVGSNNSSLPNQQLTEINSQIAAARGQKADLEARARQLRELVRSGQPVDSSDIANSESMRRLTEQGNALRSQLAEQSTTLMDQHPRIKELRAQIAEIERAKRAEGERLARQLDNDAKVAGDRLQTLTASLDQVKRLASQSNEQDVQLRSLERDAKSQRDLLESYLVKYSEASARDNVNAADAGCQTGLPEEDADGIDLGLCRIRFVGRFRRHRRLAGRAARPGILRLRLCAGKLWSGATGFRAARARAGFAAPGVATDCPRHARGYGCAAAADGLAGQHHRATVAELAHLRRGRPPRRRHRQRAQCRHHLCRHRLGACAGATGQCRAGRSGLRRAQSVSGVDRPERARPCRTGARHGVVRRHHHPRPVLDRAYRRDRQCRR